MFKKILLLLTIFFFLFPSLSYGAITDNLKVSYKFDESSGNATDDSGNGFTATNSGIVGVTYGSALINNGAIFGVANSYFNVAGLQTYQPTNFTLNVWVYRATGLTTFTNAIASFDDNDIDIGVGGSLNANPNTVVVEVWNGSSTDVCHSTATIPNNTWTMITVDRSSNVTHIYINAGSNDTAGTCTSTPFWESPDTAFHISADANGVGRSFGGTMDIYAIWDRVLTSQERTDIYNSGAGCQYPFCSSGGSTVTSNPFSTFFFGDW